MTEASAFSSSVLGQLRESDDTQQHFRKRKKEFTSFQDRVFFSPQFLGAQQENEQLLKFTLNFFQYLLSVDLDSDQ